MVWVNRRFGLGFDEIIYRLVNVEKSWCNWRTLFRFREQLSVASHGGL